MKDGVGSRGAVLVLFDVDGTLLDAGGSGRWAMTRAFEEVFGIADAEPFSRMVRFEGMTDPTIFRAIAANASIPERLLEERSARLEQSFLGHLEARLSSTPQKRALPGVVDLLDRLEGVNLAHVGLLTGNIERGARLKLQAVGLSRYFEMGGFGDDAPDRAGIGQVARKRFEGTMGGAIGPSQVVAIGDSVEDIIAARANSYRSLAVGTGWSGHDALKAHFPDLFLEDLADFGQVMQFIFGSRSTTLG